MSRETPVTCPVPAHRAGEPPAQPMVMLAVRFLLELIGFGAMPVVALTVNVAKLNSLPEDVQKIIVEVGRAWEDQNGAMMDQSQAKGLAALEENGAFIKKLPDETRKAWAESLAAFPAKEAKEAEGRGMPGVEVMNAYIKASEKLGHTWLVQYKVD